MRDAERGSCDVRDFEVVGDERIRRERHAGEKKEAEEGSECGRRRRREEAERDRRHWFRVFLVLRFRNHKATVLTLIRWRRKRGNGREGEERCESVSV